GNLQDADFDGLEEVTTEMLSMSLTGFSPNLGPIHVYLPPLPPVAVNRTIGQIEENANTQVDRLDLPPFAPGGGASSFFEVFFEVELPALGLRLHNRDPKHVAGTITHKPPDEGNEYENPQIIRLYDTNENLSPYYLIRTRHIPKPPIEHDQFVN